MDNASTKLPNVKLTLCHRLGSSEDLQERGQRYQEKLVNIYLREKGKSRLKPDD